MSLAARAVRFVVLLYQAWHATHGSASCRYFPTCSSFAVEALESHGAFRGVLLTVRRILRCRPGARWGYDPLPSRRVVASASHLS